MSQEEVSKAVLSPVAGGERLRDIVKRKNAVTACVIVSDATRGVPTAKVAPYVLDELEGGGIKRENIVFIVALGVHTFIFFSFILILRSFIHIFFQ